MVSLALSAALLLSGCATAPKAVVTLNQYPVTRFVAAEGFGESEGAARQDALVQISSYFGVTVSAKSESSTESRDVATGGLVQASQMESLLNRVETNAKHKLYSLRFTAPQVDGKRVMVIGYINRAEALGQIAIDLSDSVRVVSANLATFETSGTFWQKLKNLSDTNQLLLATTSVDAMGQALGAEPIGTIEPLRVVYRRLRANLVTSLVVRNEVRDPEGGLEAQINQELSALGIKVGLRTGITVRTSLSSTPVYVGTNILLYERDWSLTLEFLDEGGQVWKSLRLGGRAKGTTDTRAHAAVRKAALEAITAQFGNEFGSLYP